MFETNYVVCVSKAVQAAKEGEKRRKIIDRLFEKDVGRASVEFDR